MNNGDGRFENGKLQNILLNQVVQGNKLDHNIKKLQKEKDRIVSTNIFNGNMRDFPDPFDPKIDSRESLMKPVSSINGRTPLVRESYLRGHKVSSFVDQLNSDINRVLAKQHASGRKLRVQ